MGKIESKEQFKKIAVKTRTQLKKVKRKINDEIEETTTILKEDVNEVQEEKIKTNVKIFYIVFFSIFSSVCFILVELFFSYRLDVFLNKLPELQKIYFLRKNTNYIYWIKAACKLILFITPILVYGILVFFIDKKKNRKRDALKAFDEILYFKNLKKPLLTTILLVIITTIVSFAFYFISSFFINYKEIIKNLVNKNITFLNFPFIATYIVLINCLLEEIFFRGFSYLTLSKYMGNKFAIIYSSLIFSIYHLGIMVGLTSLPLIFISLIGLFLVGLIFASLNTKSRNILNSYIIHAVANIMINIFTFNEFIKLYYI